MLLVAGLDRCKVPIVHGSADHLGDWCRWLWIVHLVRPAALSALGGARESVIFAAAPFVGAGFSVITTESAVFMPHCLPDNDDLRGSNRTVPDIATTGVKAPIRGA